MKVGRFVISISASDAYGGTINLSDLIDKLNSVRDSLREAKRLMPGSQDWKFSYRVVALSRKSPYRFAIEEWAEPKQKKVHRKTAPSAGLSLVKTVRSIASGRKLPANIDVPALETYRELGPEPRRNIRAIGLSISKQTVEITENFDQKIEALLGADVFAEGSIDGSLEQIDLHRKYRFAIFPTIGPSKVLCDFDPSMKASVLTLADRRYVRVSGTLIYKTGFAFPYAVVAKNVEALPPEKEIPSMQQVRGIAPNATDGLDSVDFIESLRDGW